MPAKTMMLPCDLTDPDRLRIGETLTSEIKAREQVEAAKKAAVKDFNVALKQHKAKEHDLNESLFTGKELREVEVDERPDYAAGIVFIHRVDTGDCIQQRAIDPDERQVKLGIDGPKVMNGGKADRADEQTAGSPEEAESLRVERLAGERAERISAGVTDARERIVVVAGGEGDHTWMAHLQYGDRVLEAEAETADAARDGVAQQVTEHLDAQEDQAATWADVAAASKAEQDRQEVERLAAEQAEDNKKTKKATLGGGLKNGGLKAPKGHKPKRVKVVDANDNEITPPPEDAGEPAPGMEPDPETGLVF